MEQILAGLAPLIGHLLVSRDDGVADGAFALALQGAYHVASERSQAINDASILDIVVSNTANQSLEGRSFSLRKR